MVVTPRPVETSQASGGSGNPRHFGRRIYDFDALQKRILFRYFAERMYYEYGSRRYRVYRFAEPLFVLRDAYVVWDLSEYVRVTCTNASH